MIPFDEFQTKFFNIFTTSNFYEGKSYLDYIAEPQTNDEDNIVDTKIVLPLLTALGFESGDISKNLSGGTKDNTRPDFQVCLAEGNIRCFLVVVARFWVSCDHSVLGRADDHRICDRQQYESQSD
jgi:hypothetical protein